MTPWEDRIISAFITRYPASAAARLDPQTNSVRQSSPSDNADFPVENRALRIPAAKIFRNFDKASPDEKESFLDAAESLEAQQILSLVWVRHRKGELLSALVCRDMEKLYGLKGKASPKITAEAAREAAAQIAVGDTAKALFTFLAESITPLDSAKGINAESVKDLEKLFQAISKPANLTLRALSVLLYNDSKKLEALINSFSAVLSRAEKQGIFIPEFSFLDRSFPETSIAGRIIINIENSQALINESGSILTLPLVTAQKIESIIPCNSELQAAEPPSVLMIENKETFFTLAASMHKYKVLLYVGGHPNRAVRALVTILAKSGFVFYHTGDLDPDGILILQELQGIANNAGVTGKTVTPVYMDALTFERYFKHGRKLEPSMLQRIKLIKDETRALPGMAELIKKIENTGRGIEQEIIEYL